VSFGLSLLFLVLIASLGTAALAQEAQQTPPVDLPPAADPSSAPPPPPLPDLATFQADLGTAGRVALEKGPADPERLGCFDRLLLHRPGVEKPEILFETEGRRLAAIQAEPFSSPTDRDLLLTLDPGGSGGYAEFVLFGRAGSRLKPIWESKGLKGATARLERRDGRPVLTVEHLELAPPAGGPGSRATRVTTWYGWENGQVAPLPGVSPTSTALPPASDLTP